MTGLSYYITHSEMPSAMRRRYYASAMILALGGLTCLPATAIAQSEPNYSIQVDPSHPEVVPQSGTTITTVPQEEAPSPTSENSNAASSAPAAPAAEGANSVELVSHKDNADASPAPAANPYGLKALWNNGDSVARIVLLILLIMSAGTWIVLIVKLIEQARLFQASREAKRTFWNKGSIVEGTHALKGNSPFRYIAETGLAATKHYKGSITEQIDHQTWIALSLRRSIDMIGTRLQTGLAFLGTVGSIAPFVGLFGTVWGIYHALTAIGIAGQATIDKVAGPVGESLIMTAIGLATAVPAVLAYNWLVRRNKAAMERVRNFSSDMHAILIGGYRHEDVFNKETHQSSSAPHGQA